MSQASKQVLGMLDEYINAMAAANKKPDVLYLTHTQIEVLRAAQQAASNNSEYKPRYRGFEIVEA